MPQADRYENAVIDPVMWPCHTEHPMGLGGDTQCRGHYEARRRYPVKQHETKRLHAWQDEMGKAVAAGLDVPLPPVRDPWKKPINGNAVRRTK
jgi:hypothetical protein